MTPEEIESRMEFIIEQQAHFAVQIEQRLQSDRRLREADERLREGVQSLRELQVNLTESQMNLNAALSGLTEVVEELSRAQQPTDEHLKVLRQCDRLRLVSAPRR